MSITKSETLTIDNFFAKRVFQDQITLPGNRVYIVPEYQRRIKWEPENVKVMLDDIEEDKKFLGTVFVSTMEGDSCFDLIDGQQRITVIVMIYYAFGKVVSNDSNTSDICEYKNESFSQLKQACMCDFDKVKMDELIVDRDNYDVFDYSCLFGTSIL